MYMIIAHGPNKLSFPIYFSKDKETLIKLLSKSFKKISHNEEIYEIPINMTDEDHQSMSKILTYYYDGCGEICTLEIKKIKENTPMFGWDLD